MNIFELLAHDPLHSQQLGLNNLRSSWTTFLSHINRLVNCSQQEIVNIVKDGNILWQQISNSYPGFIRTLRQYYIYFLESLIKTRLTQALDKIAKAQTIKHKILFNSINEINQVYSSHIGYINILDDKNIIHQQFISKLTKIIQKYQLGDSLYCVLEQTFRKNCLTIFQEDIIDFDQDVQQYVKGLCTNSTANAMDFPTLKVLLSKFQQMKVFDIYFERTYLMLVRDCQNFIINCSNLQQSSKFLTNSLNYHRTFQKSFIKKIKSQATQKQLLSYSEQLEENIYFLCAKYCSNNILQIVLDYPDSHGVIVVLKKCLDRSNILSELSELLYQGVKKRLLIPGVITQNILNQYLNMLKVLQIIDPHGIVFEKMTVPIKNYLLRRNDTLRCIISHMTQNGEISTGLTRDMVRIPSKQYIDQESSDQNEKTAEQWQILNVKENKMRVRVKYQQIDLATVLVNLYGSQQAFINQYQNMLAEKLMSAKNYNIEEEIKNIQLLKMRFGQNALQMCNVIVKDVKDSRKNDTVIHKQKYKPSSQGFTLNQMNCLAVSKGYWPINYENTTSFQLPQNIKSVFSQYSDYFSKIKVMRKIHYHYNLGHVNLTLSFSNGQFQFKCLPIHAVMINHFDQDRMKNHPNGISSQQISNALHVSPNVVKQKMSFWVHKNVVKQIRQTKAALSLKKLNSIEQVENVFYKPIEEYIPVQKDQIDEDVEQFISKENTSMEGHLKHIIQGLIISILNINGPKSPEKIHLLLKTVYKTDLDYAYGQAQTLEILKKMAQKKKVTFNGQTYSTKLSK